eukprot:gene15786-biopygen20216
MDVLSVRRGQVRDARHGRDGGGRGAARGERDAAACVPELAGRAAVVGAEARDDPGRNESGREPDTDRAGFTPGNSQPGQKKQHFEYTIVFHVHFIVGAPHHTPPHRGVRT